MTVTTKLDFHHRRAARIEDLNDLVETLFTGNPNQQHAAARILLALKYADQLVPSLGCLEQPYGISRRTLQRTRAKLARFGLIERVSWMNSRHGGREGWKLSGRFSAALRRLADRTDLWRNDLGTRRREKDEMMTSLLRPGPGGPAGPEAETAVPKSP